MIHFGVCVGPGDSYERRCRPFLEAVVPADTPIHTVSGAASIFEAYDRLLTTARDADAEALVLLHDDVAVHDRNLLPRIRRRLREPDVGIVGVIGGRRLWGMRWEESHEQFGKVLSPTGAWRVGPLRGDVDVVDGLLMVVSRAAMDRVPIDTTTYDGFHGYDSDYCMSVRRAGLRVVTEPFDVHHHSNGDPDSDDFRRTRRAFEAKWADVLEAPPLSVRRPRVAAGVGEARRLAALAGPLADRVTRDARLGAGALTRRVAPGRTGRHDDPPSAPPARDDDTTSGPDLPATPPACPLCGGDPEAEPLVRAAGLAVHRCPRCDLGVTSPAPDPSIETDEIFEQSYRGERLRDRALWDLAARARLAWIELHRPDGILLEVGCATGELVVAAGRRGYEAHGVEPSEWAAAHARAVGADVVVGTLDDWRADFEGFTVDVTAVFHVLEHLPDPVGTLRTIFETTGPGGHVFVEVPNMACPSARSGDPTWAHWELPFHVTHFTPVSLASALERAGWEVVEVTEISMRPYLGLRAWDERVAAAREAGRTDPEPALVRAVARRPR